MPSEEQKPSVNHLSFEQAFSELEEVVNQLENDELSLEQSVALYERGQLLAAACSRLLEQAELRIKQINTGRLEDFENRPE